MSPSAPNRATGTDVVPADDALDLIRDRAKDLFFQQQQRVQALEADLNKQITSAIKQIESNHVSVKEQQGNSQKLDEKLDKIKVERDKAVDATTNAEALLDEARSAVAKVTHEQHDLRVKISKSEKQLNSSTNEIKKLKDQIEKSKDERSQKASDEKIALESERDQLQEQMSKVRRELAQAVSEAAGTSVELDDLRSQLIETRRELTHVESGSSASSAKLNDLREQLSETRERLVQAESTSSVAAVKLDDLREQLSETQEKLVQAESGSSLASAELDNLRQELSEARHELVEVAGGSSVVSAEVDTLRERLSEARQELAQAPGGASVTSDEVDALRQQLSDARQELAEAPGGASVDSAELDDLRERFETAEQEVRGLKAINSDLSDRLSSSTNKPEEGSATGFDWEAQKSRMMSQLESEFDDADTQQASDKLTVDNTIRITDQAITEKNLEIERLKQLLESQSNNIGDVAVGAAAIADFLDQDELISQERESLQRMQEEWREKLRQAEIDISVERARLGRERMELQTQLYNLVQQSNADGGGNQGKTDNSKPGGRWRKRLGLKDD